MLFVLPLVLLLTAELAPGAAAPADTVWPQFRGVRGRGVFDINSLPTTWSTTKNVAWKVGVAGRGWSSPIVWGDQVIVTSTVSPGAFKQPSTGIFGNDYIAELMRQGLSEGQVLEKVRARDIESTAEAGELQYMVFSFDVATGKKRWQQQAHRGAPFGGRHRKNTYASETPATDGERIYALFGNIGLFAYSMDGRVYAVNDNGVTAVFDAKSGREIYKARVGGVGNTFSASPWAHAGKVFCLSEEGDTFVLNPGDRYDEIAKNSLGEMALATPAVTRDGLFVRTATSLYRIR
jgi:outer membrane protein assembly factor BamB